MYNTFKCTNKECKNLDSEKYLSHKSGETPLCEECKTEMNKVWKSGGAIKTGDGYKA